MKAYNPRRLQMVLAIAVAMTVLAPIAARAADTPTPVAPASRPRMPEPPVPTVVALGAFGLVVADLDTEVRFYRDAVGLELVVPPSPRTVDPVHNALADTPQARRRYAIFKVPNETYSVTLEEYTGIQRTPMRAQHNDPGSSFMNFGVWNGPEAFARMRKANPTMAGVHPFPANSPAVGRMAGVWIRDPDGHLIEFMQGGWDPERKPLLDVKSVYRSHFGMTMARYQDALSFYRDILGFDLTPGFYPMMAAGEYVKAGKGMEDGLGVPAAANFTGVAGHCAFARCEMFEFRDAPRKAFHPKLQDPGAAYLSMWVSNLDDLVAKAKAANLEVVTAGGAPVTVKSERPTLVRGITHAGPPILVQVSRQIMIRDPGGFPILLMQAVN